MHPSMHLESSLGLCLPGLAPCQAWDQHASALLAAVRQGKPVVCVGRVTIDALSLQGGGVSPLTDEETRPQRSTCQNLGWPMAVPVWRQLCGLGGNSGASQCGSPVPQPFRVPLRAVLSSATRDSPEGPPFPRSGSHGVGGSEVWFGAAVGPCLEGNSTLPHLPHASGGCGADRPKV